jgi:hypothetical protein
MTRMILSIEPQDKAWLERSAKEKGVSMSECVREAIRRARNAEEGSRQESMDKLLAATSGTWRNGDGLRYQRRLRREWD